MSAEVQESGGKNGKSKQKKFAVRVDFTPMVDMNMLLITFFMLCTTLSKPQTMEITMPSNTFHTSSEECGCREQGEGFEAAEAGP